MVIDDKTKNKLLKFSDNEDIYVQFEKKLNHLSKISGIVTNPTDYKLQYNTCKESIQDYVDLQTNLYNVISNEYPNIDFGISGRFKSEYSYYEKIIKKFIDLIQKDEISVPKIYDIFAMKIFVLSVNYPVTKISVDSEGIYIDSNEEEFRISEPTAVDIPDEKKNNLVTDAFEFDYKGKNITVLVTPGQSNIYIEDNIPYITTIVDNENIVLPLSDAKNYKKSYKEDLVSYCAAMDKSLEKYLKSNGFDFVKRKNYISHPKPSGYSSIQSSFYSEEQSFGIECQTRTYDMELYNNWERCIYKPSEHAISKSSLNKTPRYILTTKFPDGPQTYAMTESECFELIYGIPLKEYRKQMQPTIALKQDKTKKEETAR